MRQSKGGTISPSFVDHRKTVQLTRQRTTPRKDANIQRLFQARVEPLPPTQQASSAPSAASAQSSELPPDPDESGAGGLQLENCKVEILMLGARELVSKPRKAEIVCEYLCAGVEAPQQSFRVLDGGQNPTFTVKRSDLERKSASKLRKMIEESQGTVLSQETKKDQLVQAMLEVPHLEFQGVPFPFVRSQQTALKISMYERPLRGPRKEFGSITIKLYCTDAGGSGGDGSGAAQDDKTMQLWQYACDSYIQGVVTLCESTRDPPEVNLWQVDEWWTKRLEFNKRVAEETLDGLMLLWWSIHSRNGKVKNDKLLDTTWNNDAVMAAAQAAAAIDSMTAQTVQVSQLRRENVQKALLKQVFCVVPEEASVNSILNTHMDLKRSSLATARTDRRIYKHDAQKWWERSSVRSTHVFETAWAASVIGADFITAGQFRQFLIKLLEPSAEDLRTAVACVSATFAKTPNIKDWWMEKLNSITSESSRRPKSKSELRSLLLDENRLTCHVEQHADGVGPSEAEYIVDAEEQDTQNSLLAGLSGGWIGTGGLDDEGDSSQNDVRIDIPEHSACASRFDPFLWQWRQIYDRYGSEIPRIEEEWVDVWQAKNNNQRMTASTDRSRRSLFTTTDLFTRTNFVEVLSDILKLNDDITEKLFKELDMDSSGDVDKDEAQEWFDENARQGGQLRFELAWAQADLDCSNGLDFAEFKKFIKVLLCPTDSDVDVMLDEISQIEENAEADDSFQRQEGESKTEFENRCIQLRNDKRRERKEEKERRDAKANVALVHFKAAKENLDRIDSFPGEDEEQRLLDLVANVDAAIRRAESRQEKFSRVVLASWEKGRKYLPKTWEESCKGGMVPFFPRYLLSANQSIVQVEGDTTVTEGDTTDYETDAESDIPRINTGAIRCAFRVSLPENPTAETELHVAETRRWEEVKALMSPHPVIVRIYVIEGTGLRAMSGNTSSTYLQCSLGKQTIDTKARCVSKSLHPEWREMFEFETVLPGPAVVRLQVKHHSSFSKDKDIGVTEIDLERRYFCDQWRRRRLSNIETRSLNAKGLTQLAKLFGNTGHGAVKLWVDIHQQHSGVPIPSPVDIARPPTEHFQLRLIIWNAEGIPLQGSNKALNCHNMSFSAHMRTTEGGNVHEVKKETDTHWRAKDGRGNFNHRMVFDFEVDARLPVKQPCLLTLKCWDKEPLRLTNKLLGYKEVNISGILESALEERLTFMKQRQRIDEHIDVGNLQDMQNLLVRFKEQNARADQERDDKDNAARLRRSELVSGNSNHAEEEDEETEEEMVAESSSCGAGVCKSCSGTSQNLASAVGQLNEDATAIDVLHATHEYRKNNVRCLHLDLMGDTQAGTDIPMVWATVELMHKSLADERKAGDGRGKPNENPILEEPEREKIGIRNIMGSLSVLVGAKNVKLAKLLIGVVLVVVIAMEIIPQVTSAFVMQALRKGLPLPCAAGFEKASDVYKDACGARHLCFSFRHCLPVCGCGTD